MEKTRTLDDNFKKFKKGNVLHCPDCGRMILSRVNLVNGTFFLMKCAHCKKIIEIKASYTQIYKKVLQITK